jgi:uncharacterized protein YhaN
LKELRDTLESLKKQSEATDTAASVYARLCNLRDEAKMRFDSASTKRNETQHRLSHVRRLAAAMPRWEALKRFETDLAELSSVPRAPAEWRAALPDLRQRAQARHLAQELAATKVARLTQELAAIVVDQPALRLQASLERFDLMRARYVTGERDLPTRRSEREGAQARIDVILARLARETERDPARLLLTSVQREALKTLIKGRTRIEADIAAAADELASAVQALNEAQQALGEHSAEDGLGPAIATALAVVRGSDHALRLRGAERNRDRHAQLLESALLALAPWTGDAQELAMIAIPDTSTISDWSNRLQEADAALTARRQTAEQAEARLAETIAVRDAIRRTEGVVTDQSAAEIRQKREAAWAEHRQALSPETATLFETALRYDDQVTAARAAHAQLLAELHEKERSLAMLRSEAAHAQQQLQDASASRQTQADMIATAAARIASDFAAIASASWLQQWVLNREKALQNWEAMQLAQTEIRAAALERAALRDKLAVSLTRAQVAFDSGAELETLTELAEAAMEQERRLAASRQTVAERQRAFRQRDLAVQKAATAERLWATAWREACAACWLGETDAVFSVEAVRTMLDDIAELATVLEQERSLANRIRDMESDLAVFLLELDRLEQELCLSASGAPPLERAQVVTETINAAMRATVAKREKQEELRAACEAQEKLQSESAAETRQVEEMMAQMQVDSMAALDLKLREAARRQERESQAAEATAEILTGLSVENIEQARLLLDAQTTLALELEQSGLQEQLEQLDTQTRETYAALTQATQQVEAIGGDDAVAMLDAKRRTTLLMVEESARRHLHLRFGIAAAERALRAYRDKHRSSMMRRASEAFQTISCGAYRGLAAQPSDAGEILVALGADGSSKQAGALSKGTRFQLYLALRAAGYYEFAALRPPVPFIADDIMETFDDLRAEETLRIFAAMAEHGQVIYLTHHEHLRVMAERMIPGVRVHRMPD